MEGEVCAFSKVVHSKDCPPLVFRGVINNWPALQWTPRHLANILGDKQFQAKLSSISSSELQWETECPHLMMTLQQYCDWLDCDMTDDNPLRHVNKDKYSCYIDYKYMKDLFKDNPAVLKDVDWSVFGLDNRDGMDSTLWMGSSGAYTPCHQDTYGFNLVAQICGRKRWYLFDPKQSELMYLTRIPYEESSIYSEVNIRSPDLNRQPLFKKTSPYIIELEPGDVLYVPRHWWHHVESLQPSISVNTWVPLEEDVNSHLQESMCRLLFTTMSTALLSNKEMEEYVNTNEKLHPARINLEFVQSSVRAVSKYNREKNICCNKIPETPCNNKGEMTTSENEMENKFDDESLSCQSAKENKTNFEKFAKTFSRFSIRTMGRKRIGTFKDYKMNSGVKAKVEMKTELNFEENADMKINTDSRKRKMDAFTLKGSNAEQHKLMVCKKIHKNNDDHNDGIETLDDNKDSSDDDIKTNNCKCESIKVDIFASTCMQFKEFLIFLENEFGYDIEETTYADNYVGSINSEGMETKLTFKHTGETTLQGCKPVEILAETDSDVMIHADDLTVDACESEATNEQSKLSIAGEAFISEPKESTDIQDIDVVDIMNSILDPGVIKHIATVLVNKMIKP